MVILIRLLACIVFFFSIVGVSQAKTVVFIHGYMTEGSIWLRSGIVDHLGRNGWAFAGRYGYNAMGNVVQDVHKQGKNAVVTVELPWDQPVATQARLLSEYLAAIHQDRPEPMVLVGHSAGGVVARFNLIQEQPEYVHALITIATPHLGTPMADLGALASDSPLGMFLQGMGDSTLLRSRGLFRDLQPARQGSFLHWLNHQEHPAIPYFSIIRSSAAVDFMDYGHADLVVPPEYQDMNNVPVLRGRSVSIASDGGHALNVYDAIRIQKILAQL